MLILAIYFFTYYQYFIVFLCVMNVLVYNGEKFQRNNLWYLIFAVIFASVFVLSILNNNIVGAVLIFFLLGWYFYYSTINNQIVKIIIDTQKLVIGNKSYLRNAFVWYVVEISPEQQQIKNIVFITEKSHIIYTFDDSLEHIKMFLTELDGYLPMLSDFHQSSFEKLSRKAKL